MAKVFLINGVNGNVLENGVVNEGKFLKFGYNNNYIGVFDVPFKPDLIREIDIISILNVENKIEIGYVIDNKFDKFYTSIKINNLIKGMSNITKGNIFVGRVEEKTKGIAYTQYLYGYKKGFLTDLKLMEAMKANG